MISVLQRGLTVAAAGLIAAATWGGSARAAPDPVSITIASGRTGGLYHPVAGAICKLVNEKTSEHGITCTVEFGDGSISNIEDLRDGEVLLAMAQSDIQRDAVEGTGPFADEGGFEAMRSMVALFVEQATVLARKDADIATFQDLKGKRFYLPRVGSGGRLLMERLFAAEGWGPGDIDILPRYDAPNLAQALCDHEFDAFSVTVGHPSPLIREATNTCDAVLVPISGPIIGKVIAAEPMYARSVIPAGTYRGNRKDVAGIGLVATLVTTTDLRPDVAYQVTKAFVEALDRLAQESSLFKSLNAKELAVVGLTAPLHEGAARYFEEAGLK